MLTIDYIVNDISPLQLSNTIGEAKKMFLNLRLSHLPVVENNTLVGLLAEADLPGLDNDSLTIKEIRYNLVVFFAKEDESWLELLKVFDLNESNFLPIINEQNNYIGYYELSDVLHFFNHTPFLQENGNIIVVSKNKIDYSISEIAQIIESNQAKLLGVIVSKEYRDTVELTIKLYSDNINDVIHTFRRYDYKIIRGINEDEYLNDLKERSEYFQKYLNI